MHKVTQGAAQGKVILLTGATNRPVLEQHVLPRFTCEHFSGDHPDLARVECALRNKRWDGKPVVVLFHRCDTVFPKLIPLVRARHSRCAALFVTDGGYSRHSRALESIVDVRVAIGRAPPALWTLLKRRTRDTTYREVVECGGLEPLLEQLHHSAARPLEMSADLSDADVLARHVPDELVVDALPVVAATIGYTARPRPTKDPAFIRDTVCPLVAKTTGGLRSAHASMEYVRWAHTISATPELAVCPRDDADPALIRAVNDKIRVLAVPKSSKRRRGK